MAEELFATVDDVQAVYEQEIPAGARKRVDLLLRKAQARLLARVPSIRARLDAGSLEPVLVRGALEDIVLRVLRNPNGYSMEQAGEFAYRIDRAVASGRIQITDEDVAPLLPPAARRPAGSIRVSVPARQRLP